MNLAFKYPIIFWDCACLITESGGADSNTESKTTNYGKIATAIGKMKKEGVNIVPPDINNSSYTFAPDVDKSIIRFGLSGIINVGKDVIQTIIKNRPYSSLKDFLSKTKLTAQPTISLIKSGAFDCFDERVEVMTDYISSMAGLKKRLTMQNANQLFLKNVLPEKFNLQKRIFNFNKYLKKNKILNTFYRVDNIAYNFYEENFDVNKLQIDEEGFIIPQYEWDAIYSSEMEIVKEYITDNQKELLSEFNDLLFEEFWNDKCGGSVSKWEMDSISCYFHEHELANLDYEAYGISNFFDLPEKPIPESTVTIRGSKITKYELTRVAGTVVDRNKDKKSITLLTREGIITVKLYGQAFTDYDKQLSEKDSKGVKHVLEQSWFTRGNKVIFCGMRRDNEFICKKYARTPYNLVELITDINDETGKVMVKGCR